MRAGDKIRELIFGIANLALYISAHFANTGHLGIAIVGQEEDWHLCHFYSWVLVSLIFSSHQGNLTFSIALLLRASLAWSIGSSCRIAQIIILGMDSFVDFACKLKLSYYLQGIGSNPSPE